MYRGIREPLNETCNYCKCLMSLKDKSLEKERKGRFHNMYLSKLKLHYLKHKEVRCLIICS